jgi:hypothetical protein
MSPPMSLENARTVYPILIRLARELSAAIKQGRSGQWITYEEFCRRCTEEAGMKETPRTVVMRVLRPLQVVCIEHELPDLSSLIVQKPKGRGGSDGPFRPSDGWWEPYVAKGEAAIGDIPFWFGRYKAARDFEQWPEAPFF